MVGRQAAQWIAMDEFDNLMVPVKKHILGQISHHDLRV